MKMGDRTRTTNRPGELGTEQMDCPGLSKFPELLPPHFFSEPKFSCSVFQWLVPTFGQGILAYIVKR